MKGEPGLGGEQFWTHRIRVAARISGWRGPASAGCEGQELS